MTYSWKFLKRALFSALFVFLSSCSPACHSWKCETIQAADSYAILYLSPKNDFQNIEIELQKQRDGTCLYLSVYGIPLQTNAAGNIDVGLMINGETLTYRGYLLQGGHRIRLDSEAEAKLFEALCAHTPITIRVGRYSTEIHYEKFDDALKNFNEVA